MLNPIQSLEMMEYCTADTLVTQIETIMQKQGLHREPSREAIRQVLHMHRFHIFAYLTNSGVALPIAAIRDEVHVKCGEQLPDQERPTALVLKGKPGCAQCHGTGWDATVPCRCTKGDRGDDAAGG